MASGGLFRSSSSLLSRGRLPQEDFERGERDGLGMRSTRESRLGRSTDKESFQRNSEALGSTTRTHEPSSSPLRESLRETFASGDGVVAVGHAASMSVRKRPLSASQIMRRVYDSSREGNSGNSVSQKQRTKKERSSSLQRRKPKHGKNSEKSIDDVNENELDMLSISVRGPSSRENFLASDAPNVYGNGECSLNIEDLESSEREESGSSVNVRGNSTECSALETKPQTRLVTDSGVRWHAKDFGDPDLPPALRGRTHEEFIEERLRPLEVGLQVMEDLGPPGVRDAVRREAGLPSDQDEWSLARYRMLHGSPRPLLPRPPKRLDIDEDPRASSDLDVVHRKPLYARGGNDGLGFLSRPREAAIVEQIEETVHTISQDDRHRLGKSMALGIQRSASKTSKPTGRPATSPSIVSSPGSVRGSQSTRSLVTQLQSSQRSRVSTQISPPSSRLKEAIPLNDTWKPSALRESLASVRSQWSEAPSRMSFENSSLLRIRDGGNSPRIPDFLRNDWSSSSVSHSKFSESIVSEATKRLFTQSQGMQTSLSSVSVPLEVEDDRVESDEEDWVSEERTMFPTSQQPFEMRIGDRNSHNIDTMRVDDRILKKPESVGLSLENTEDKPCPDDVKDGLFLQSCEAVLDFLRQREKQLLARRRAIEFERLRGPRPRWWELKGPNFREELRRYKETLQPEWRERDLYLEELMSDI